MTNNDALRAELNRLRSDLLDMVARCDAATGRPRVHQPRRMRPDLSPAAREAVTRLAYSPSETAQALGTSRAHIYNLLNNGTLRSVTLGARRLIPAAELDRVLDAAGGHAAAALDALEVLGTPPRPALTYPPAEAARRSAFDGRHAADWPESREHAVPCRHVGCFRQTWAVSGYCAEHAHGDGAA